jgi:PAS domain S-box-containing protein
VYLSRRLSNGAVVAAELSLSALQDFVATQEHHGITSAGFTFITDDTGTVLAHPQKSLVDQQANLGQLEIIQLSKAANISRVYVQDGVWVLGSATHSEATGWVVVAQIPLAAAYGSYLLTLSIIGLLLTAVVVLLALSFRNQFRRQVNAPLAQLSSAAEALATHDFVPSTPVEAGETAVAEIDTLITSFYNMSRAIQTRQTALEESQHEFQTLLNSITDYVWSADVVKEQITYRYYSPVVEKITGYPQEHFMQSVTAWLDMIHPDDQEQVRRDLAHEFEGQIVAHEYRIVHAEGHIKWLHGTTSPTLDEQGNVIRLDGVVSDITEWKQAEEVLRQAQKMESLGVMAGGMAHDFNNLLAAIISRASLALTVLPAQSPGRRHIEKLMEAAERAANLTRQLLAYSGGGQFQIQLIDLNELIEENMLLFRAALPKSVSLLTELTRPFPYIEGDFGQIQQVLINVITNAGEAISEGAGQVKLVTSVRDVDETNGRIRTPSGNFLPSGKYVSLQIEDNGSGMDEETLAKIFDPFFSTKFTGRGLGLAAVQGIIQTHKGALQVQSHTGQGTTIQLFFPASQQQPEPIVEPPIPALTSSGLILLIDDEAAVREAVTDILATQNLSVITAPNGREGITLFQERQTDIQLIILDLSMPGLNGEETCYQLVKINPHTPIILSSGYSESEIGQRCRDMGVNAFLQKPYNFSRLITAVREFVPEETAVS